MNHAGEAVASLILAALAGIGLYRLLARVADDLDARSALPWAVAVAMFLLFSLDQASNWLWGWQVAVYANVFGAIWCVERLSAGPASPLRALQAAGLAAVAVYGFATGWALIPIGYALLVWRGAFKRWRGWFALAIWTALTALLLVHLHKASQQFGSSYVAENAPSSGVLGSVFGLAHYALNYVSNALVRFSSEIAGPVFVVHLVVIGLVAFSLDVEARRRLSGLAPLAALSAYAVGAGLLTGLGRLETFGADTAFVSRYITFANFYWIGLLSALALIAPKLETRRRLAIGFVCLSCAMKIGVMGNVLQKAVPRSLEIREAGETLRVCYPRAPAAALVSVASPEQTDIPDRLAALREHRFSLFRDGLQTVACAEGDDRPG